MIESILQYQQLDLKLRKIEQELGATEERKRSKQWFQYLKESEEKLKQMEEHAEQLFLKLNKLKDSYAENKELIAEYTVAVDKSIDLDELNYLNKKFNDLNKTVSLLDRDIAALLKDMEETSAQFEEYRQKLPKAKKQYNDAKIKFDSVRKEREPEIIAIKKEMAQKEKEISADVLERYRKLKSQGIYPPFVELLGENQCGGCRVDMPMSMVSRLSEKGYIECENCHRIIYKS